jgi:hypothetical protein
MGSVNWLNRDAAEEAVRVNGSKNCPNCGGVIESERCPYCGTLFIDFACMDADKPFFMKVKKGDQVFIVKVMTTSVSMHREPTCLYADNMRYAYQMAGPTEITLDFVVVP